MSQTVEMRVPDIGDYKDVPVIELYVAVGDMIAVDTPLLTLESDKATMEVPSTAAGRISEILVKAGDRVGEGSVIARLEVAEAAAPGTPEASPAVDRKYEPKKEMAAAAASPSATPPPPVAPTPANSPLAPSGPANGPCGPSVRRLARQLGVDLAKVVGSGSKDRISQEDIIAHVKRVMQSGASETRPASTGTGLDLLPWPKIDFEKFGPIERRPKSRIQKISAANLHRNWVMMPHVTNFDEADITELEAFRQKINGELGKEAAKVTLLAFLI